MGAEQLALLLAPAQVQVKDDPVSVTAGLMLLAELHRLLDGAVGVVTPLAEPHVPVHTDVQRLLIWAADGVCVQAAGEE